MRDSRVSERAGRATANGCERRRAGISNFPKHVFRQSKAMAPRSLKTTTAMKAAKRARVVTKSGMSQAIADQKHLKRSGASKAIDVFMAFDIAHVKQVGVARARVVHDQGAVEASY